MPDSVFKVIRGASVFAPHPLGAPDVVILGGKIARVGPVDERQLERAGFSVEIFKRDGEFLIPGLIDPHEHLIGGSGERGFGSQTPEITANEILESGITTVVGCLGVDSLTRTMPALVAKAKSLMEQGITARVYSGGYDVPPVTLTGSIRTDLLYVTEIIGAGEIAISDVRSAQPTVAELAKLVSDAYVGGLLSGKAGVTHFHVGPGPRGLAPLRDLLEHFDVHPGSLYPTHVERSEALLKEAVALTKRGVCVDIDTVDQDLDHWLPLYFDYGGDPALLTLSSDAAINSPRNLYEQVKSCVFNRRIAPEVILPLVTTNTARILKLHQKGQIRVGADADLVVMTKDWQIREVFAGGNCLVADGGCIAPEPSLEESNRKVVRYGKKYDDK